MTRVKESSVKGNVYIYEDSPGGTAYIRTEQKNAVDLTEAV